MILARIVQIPRVDVCRQRLRVLLPAEAGSKTRSRLPPALSEPFCQRSCNLPHRRHRSSVVSPRSRIGTFALLAGAAGLTVLWYCRRPPTLPDAGPAPAADPRLAAATEWPNVHPDVRYTGDESCAGCHATLTRSFRQHPMGRSLSPVAAASPIEKFDAAAHDPFDAGGLRYRVERRGDEMVHRASLLDGQGRVLTEQTAAVRYAVGSGQR